jgi:hypothetical protein
MTDAVTATDKEVREWLRDVVAPAIQQLLDSDLIFGNHCAAEKGALLHWLAEAFVPADPASFVCCDGPNDGRIDVLARNMGENFTEFIILQETSPEFAKLQKGSPRGTAGQKIVDDVKGLYNQTLGPAAKARSLNETTKRAVADILQAVDFAGEQGSTDRVTIRVLPITLKHWDAKQREDYAALQDIAKSKWSLERPNVTWVLEDVITGELAYSRWIGKKDQAAPTSLELGVVGQIAEKHHERGPWLCFVSGIDLLEACRQHGPGIFDGNLRFSLGQKTKVNKTIMDEISTVTGIKWFHSKNNGVTIACRSCSARSAGERTRLHLSDPQIINGCQTVVTLTEEFLRLLTIPKRSEADEARLAALRTELLIPAKIVSSQRTDELDAIAISSNTQNPLSARTLRSSAAEMKKLKILMAGVDPAWFLETKDGEWDAISDHRSMLASVTKGRGRKDFQYSDKKRDVRVVTNTNLGIALLAFYGVVEDAKKTKVFDDDVFTFLFNWHVDDSAWIGLRDQKPRWTGKPPKWLVPGPPSVSQAQLAYLCWTVWKDRTYPDSRQLEMAFEVEARRDPEFARFREGNEWNVPEDRIEKLKRNDDSVYWTERFSKAAYSALTYQTMRVLTWKYGQLTADRCAGILALPEFSDLARGLPMPEFRGVAIDGRPLTLIARSLQLAVERLWARERDQMRVMLSPQQDLLRDEWVARLSRSVDQVCESLGSARQRQIFDMASAKLPDDCGFGDLFPEIGP